MSSHEPEERGGSELAPHQSAIWAVLGLAVVLVAGLFAVRMEHNPESTRDYPIRALIADAKPVLLPAPEVDEEYLPCVDCHEDEPVNREVREFEEEHDEHEFSHGNIWCLHCHDAEEKESLHLADGTPVAMEDSWQVCTQCHAKKLPDWRAGVHGKRTGHWRGPKEYRTCVVCHDPHVPAFEPLEPMPPPRPPHEITAGTGQPADEQREESHGDS
jgi:hypothetical protein